MLSFLDPLLIILSLGLFAYGMHRRRALWRLGLPEERNDGLRVRISSVLRDVFGHGRILRERYPGVMHLFIFYGFLVPFSLVVLFQFFFSLPALLGRICSLLLDIIGSLGLVGVVLAAIRRYVRRPARLESTPTDAVGLALIFFILFFGFFVEGFRFGATPDSPAAWSPVGFALGSLFRGLGLAQSSQVGLHGVFWRLHFYLVLGFVAYLPHSKLVHIIVSPVNIFLRSRGPKGALTPIDIENAETFGASTVREFTWKQLLDLDACMQCGRCQDRCPAFLSEKPLTPKKVINDLKEHLQTDGPGLLSAEGDEAAGRSLVGEIVSEDELWACTTCRACMEICPVYVEHIDKIVEMRRYQVLMESQFPQEIVATFKNMETNSNPWGIGLAARADWTEGLDVKTVSDGSDTDLLFYVGCAGSFDERYKLVAADFVKILQTAGVSFVILGTEEKCCGDSARRIGNEYLFQMMAVENIETMKAHKVKKIVTLCPHCFNTLKNEYPQFDGAFDVVHYTEFLLQLIEEGTIRLTKKLSQTVAYHDSCYLGRYNHIYDAPRKIVKAIPGARQVELVRNRSNSFCCGAGGGRMWMEELIGQRINEVRTDEILGVNPNVIGTACPYCLTMFEDGIKARNAEDRIVAKDLIELVRDSMA